MSLTLLNHYVIIADIGETAFQVVDFGVEDGHTIYTVDSTRTVTQKDATVLELTDTREISEGQYIHLPEIGKRKALQVVARLGGERRSYYLYIGFLESDQEAADRRYKFAKAEADGRTAESKQKYEQERAIERATWENVPGTAAHREKLEREFAKIHGRYPKPGESVFYEAAAKRAGLWKRLFGGGA